MNCEHAGNPELVEKYVSGQLPNDEAATFELHYFECEECLAAVQTGQAIGGVAAAKSPSPKVIPMPARAAGRPKWIYPVAAAAALVVATLAGWRFFGSPSPKPGTMAVTRPEVSAPEVAAQPQVKAPAPAGSVLVAMNRLEAVDALPYRGSVLRGSNNEDSAERFKQAMTSYNARDYRAAAVRLSGIPVGVPGSGRPEDHITDAGVQLYLGVSRLILDENGRAVEALKRAVKYGDTPYLESAGYYLAKGLIRQKYYPEAAAQLRETIALNGDRQSAAQQLLEDLNKFTAK
jgi:anti-sigma factor RsiW